MRLNAVCVVDSMNHQESSHRSSKSCASPILSEQFGNHAMKIIGDFAMDKIMTNNNVAGEEVIEVLQPCDCI